MNRQQLVSRLARNHTVLYSNGSWHTWDRGDPEWRQSPLFGSIDMLDGVWVEASPRILMRTPRIGLLDRYVLRRHAERWRDWLDQRAEGPLILQVFDPEFVDFVQFVKADAVVYQPYDFFELMGGWNSELDLAERRLLSMANLVVTPSAMTGKALEAKSNRQVSILPNGVDFDMFEAAVAANVGVPHDLAAIPRPRIGYMGWLEPHLDLSLICTLAQRRPEWHFVFVGGRTSQHDDRLAREIDACARQPNIHLLGPRQHAEVPSYMCNMDVNTICWRAEKTGLALFGSPLKLFEYLASGRPVVSTELPFIQPDIKKCVQTARSPEEWEAALEVAVRSSGPGTAAMRQALARENSWDRKCEELERMFETLVPHTSTTP